MTLFVKMLLALVTAAVIAAVFSPVSIKVAGKIGAIDVPKDERRMHKKPTPRFGGMAMFIAGTATIAIYLHQDTRVLWVILGGALIYLLGIIDDLKNLPAKFKFLVQTAIAVGMYFCDLRISFIRNYFGGGKSQLGEVLCFIVTVLWIVGVTNTVNLIDGMDGLAAGTSAIESMAIAYVAYLNGMNTVAVAMFALAGATIGFLPFNFYPAKTFMGDGGSLYLGFMLATVSILGPVKSATIVALIVPVLVLGVPLFDTFFAIFRRLINKRPIMEADKGHLHHRLARLGYGQRRATLMLYAITATMGVVAIVFSRGLWVESIALFLVACVLIYILITDPNHMVPQVRVEKKEEKDQ